MKSSAAGIRSLSKSSVLCLLSFLLLLGFMQAVAAQTPEEKGFLIAKQNDDSDVGFGDSVVDGTMVLRNAAGSETRRNLEIRTLEVNEAGLGDRSLIIFNRPRDINGTALLSHTKVNDTDDQWIFLPALKRTKRIASKNKSGPFVGSEFAFEDFTSSALDKFKYKYLKTEACGPFACDVIERVPVDRFSGYSRQEVWIDQQDLQLRRIDFFDRKKSLLKTLQYEDYRIYKDKYWRAHKLLMFNHQTDKSTDLISEEFVFQKGLRKRDFVRGILTRLR